MGAGLGGRYDADRAVGEAPGDDLWVDDTGGSGPVLGELRPVVGEDPVVLVGQHDLTLMHMVRETEDRPVRPLQQRMQQVGVEDVARRLVADVGRLLR